MVELAQERSLEAAPARGIPSVCLIEAQATVELLCFLITCRYTVFLLYNIMLAESALNNVLSPAVVEQQLAAGGK
jgi:hypothetical protein